MHTNTMAWIAYLDLDNEGCMGVTLLWPLTLEQKRNVSFFQTLDKKKHNDHGLHPLTMALACIQTWLGLPIWMLMMEVVWE